MAEITLPVHQIEIGGIVMVIKRFKVFKDYGDFIDVCDEDGNCLKVPKKIAFPEDYKNELIMKAMKDAVLKVAQDLAVAKNTVTTLEIKVILRRDYPYYFWTQDIVSKFMDQLAGDGIFTYTDNGTFRIYSLVNAVKPAVPTTVLTKTVTASPANTVSVASVAGGIAKVSKKKIGWAQVLNLAANPNFKAVTLANGTVVDRVAIKSQKKSTLGYISPKQGRIASIVVGNTQYNVI